MAWRIASKFEESLLVVIMAHPCRTTVLVAQYTKLVPAASIAASPRRQAKWTTGNANEHSTVNQTQLPFGERTEGQRWEHDQTMSHADRIHADRIHADYAGTEAQYVERR
ncbi:hypothetical protein P0F65_11290 [Sphingomonas sp. I4]